MNGPDLRILAERASVLEDRTLQRLDEVHDRIAVARERRRTGAALGAAGLVVALVVGLAVVQRSQDRGSPGPAPKPTTTATVGSDAAPPPPAQGTCWAVAPELIGAAGITYDDSQPVPCTEPHTTETVSTFSLAEATPETAEPTAPTCGNMVGQYLGIDNESWVDAGSLLLLPSEEQVADGAAWARCDAFVPSPWWAPVSHRSTGARTVTASIRGLADGQNDDLWVCLAHSPTVDQPYVPCDEPHAYEATGTLAGLGGISTYPSADQLQAEAEEDCAPAVPRRLAGAAVTAAWSSEEDFHWGIVNGVCFLYDPSGKPLPPR